VRIIPAPFFYDPNFLNLQIQALPGNGRFPHLTAGTLSAFPFVTSQSFTNANKPSPAIWLARANLVAFSSLKVSEVPI